MQIFHMASASSQHRRFAIAAVALALAVAVASPGLTARHAAAAPSGNAVTFWNGVAEKEATIGRPPAGAFYLMGIANVAIYDATIAIEGGSQPFIARPVVPSGASADAAIAAAARGVLVVRVPGQAADVEVQYANFLATIPDGPAKTDGIFVGEQVAQAVIAWRTGDGFDNVVPYVQPPTGPGVFEPVLPSEPVDVKLKQVRPLTFASNSQFRPDGPNPLTSAEYAEDYNEVKALGRADSTVRTPEQTATALFWADNAAHQWPRNLRRLAIDRSLTLTESARMLALTQVAAADALLSCFDAKYYYLSWRPLHAIQRGDTDGNPATVGDPTWRSLLTVNHPEYPSAHGCVSTAIVDALAAFFGTDLVVISMDSLTFPGTRYYDHLNAVTREIANARVWGGLHFRNSIAEGDWIGRKVARHVSQNFFLPSGA